MDIKVKELDNAVIKSCETIADCYNELESLTEEYDFFNADRSGIDRYLVKMVIEIEKLMELALPMPSAGELHGLPEEATQLGPWQSNVTITDAQHPNFDFGPWFAEKVSQLHKCFFRVMGYLETNPKKLNLKGEYKDRAEEHINGLIRLNMGGIKAMTDKLLDMFGSGRLKIADVKVDFEDEDE